MQNNSVWLLYHQGTQLTIQEDVLCFLLTLSFFFLLDPKIIMFPSLKNMDLKFPCSFFNLPNSLEKLYLYKPQT